MASEVPQDLITQILKLLPAKTLLRFRCISKSLCSFIDSPDFINSHLTQNSNHRRIIIFQEDDLNFDINPNIPINVLDIDDDPCPLEFRKGNRFDSGIRDGPCYDSYKVYAHCNGLVLIAEGFFSLVVWNPSTRKCRKLPLLPLKMKGMKPQRSVQGLGFCYDSFEDDYKVIVMRTWKNYYYEPYNEIWILGLRSGYWRKIQNFPYEYSFYLRVNQVSRNTIADGAFHFICLNRTIYALDLAKETFSIVPFPNFDKKREHDSFLRVLEGCLCVGFISQQERPFELFARKKNDVGEFSWTKLFSIDPYQVLSASDFYVIGFGEILGFSKGGDKMYVLYGQCEVYSYDFKEKIIERIVAENKPYQKVLFCTESLVWMEKKKKKKKMKKAILEQL